MGKNTPDRSLVYTPRRRATPVVILWLPGAQANKIIDECVTRPDIERGEVVTIDERHIGDAPQIEHCDGDGVRPLEHAHHCTMKYRHHWSTLPPGCYIGGAKVVDDRNAEPRGERRSVGKLDAVPAPRPM